MAEYLTLVVTVSFFCALVSAVMGEKGSGKTARAVINVIMLAVVVLPIVNAVANFSSNISVPVINEGYSHSIDNKKDDVTVYREWLAKVTATQLSEEIERSVKDGIGITVRVECPWHFEGENVVFDRLRIYTASEERYFEKIESYVKLHFSLDGTCTREVE